MFAAKIAALDAVRASPGTTDSADLLVSVLAAAWAWVSVPLALGSLAATDVAQRRAHVITSIETLCAAADSGARGR